MFARSRCLDPACLGKPRVQRLTEPEQLSAIIAMEQLGAASPGGGIEFGRDARVEGRISNRGINVRHQLTAATGVRRSGISFPINAAQVCVIRNSPRS
jgi:hypothetical protein